MTARTFKGTRSDGFVKAPSGFDVVTIDLAFVPEFIKVHFYDTKKKAPVLEFPDTVEWSLNISGSTAQLVISYDVIEERTIRYVAAILPVDPEETIVF